MIGGNAGAEFQLQVDLSGVFKYGGGLRSDVVRRGIQISCLALQHGGDIRL